MKRLVPTKERKDYVPSLEVCGAHDHLDCIPTINSSSIELVCMLYALVGMLYALVGMLYTLVGMLYALVLHLMP